MADQQPQSSAEPSTTTGTDAVSTREQSNARTESQSQTPASAPAPVPGPHALRLQQIYAQRLNHTLSKLSWENFAGCYPTIAKRAENVLRKVHEQMVSMLRSRCEVGFEGILVSRQVVVKLNELYELVGDAQQRRLDSEDAGITKLPTPPHTLPPSTILAAHMHPALAQHQSQLHAHLQTTQSQNKLLVDEVRRQRAEVDELLARLEDAAEDVRGANEALAGIVGELADETRLDAEHV